MKYIVGIDEVGRGPLAGPLTLCAVRLSLADYSKLKKRKDLPKAGYDSKKLSQTARKSYSKLLIKLCKDNHGDNKMSSVNTQGAEGGLLHLQFWITDVSNQVIDKKGLSFAIKFAVAKCLSKLSAKTDDKVLLDGSLKAPVEFRNQMTIIKGDEKEKIISWASILAKVHRDRLMVGFANKYPQYGFEEHKGYGTKKHRQAIKKYGLTKIHRKSFC